MCPRAVTFGGLRAVGRVGFRVPGLHLGVLLCLGAGVMGAGLSPAGHPRGSRSSPLEFQRENSLSRRPALGYSSGRAPRELPCCFENWSPSTDCIHGNRIISQQTARLPEIGCGLGASVGRGAGEGKWAKETCPPVPPRAPGRRPLPPTPSRREPAMGEVRGQLLAVDRSSFRHTFPEECGGFVPAPVPAPSPEARGHQAGTPVPLLIFYSNAGELPGRQVNY